MMLMLQESLDLGEMIFHHTADACTVNFYPIGAWRIPGCHLTYPMAATLSPTKHVVWMIIAAVLVLVTMLTAARSIARQQPGSPPKGFSGAVEGMVLFVRNDIAIANIGHDGARFAPLIITLFFFILYCNLLGLMPWGSSATGNLGVTAALAIVVFLVVEIGGLIKLGPKGYFGTVFPHVEGLHGAGAVAMSIFMAPIEILGKLVKPFALAVRLFGNMTAGHFVILALFGIIFLFGQLGVASWGIGIVTALVVVGVMMLELIVALLQAYVFALLSSVFIGLMQHEH